MNAERAAGVVADAMDDREDDRLGGLRIGVDMDGVLSDFIAGWMALYARDFGRHLEVADVTSWDGMHELTHFRSMGEFWAWARGGGESVFRHLPPMPGAMACMERLAVEHRVVILSSKSDWAIPDSLAWLSEHRVPAREVHFLWRKSAVSCDVYLDDAPHHLRELRAARPDAVVCRRVHPWNDPLPGVVDIESWPRFEAVVARVARERSVAIG